MSEPQQSILISIPVFYDEGVRQQIGEEIVEFIVQRTRKGLDKNNRLMPKYSPEYVDTVEFKAASKNQGKPNLTLTGDMLASLQVLSTGRGFVKIGWESGFENDKAAWNKEKGRDILGIARADLDKILRNYPAPQTETTGLIASLATEALRRVFTR